MNKSKKVVVVVMVVVAVTAASLWKWTQSRHMPYAGTLEATEVDLSSRLSSVIETYHAKESDAIKAGQVLVSLTCEEQKLASDLAEKDFRRAERLLRSGSVPQETFDRLQYVRDEAVMKRSWCTVVSPANGRVLETYQEAGERVNPGTKLLTVADLSDVYAYVYVPQPLLAQLSLGMTVTGTLPEMKGRTFPGKIAHIRDEAEFTPKNVQTRDERTRLVYGVKIVFANPDTLLKPGMTIEARLP